MHRILGILEIIEEALGHLYDPEEEDASNRHWKHDLAMLARTCKAFQEPALNLLWRKQYTLNHVLRCLPPDSWEEVFKQPPGLSRPRNGKIQIKRPLQPDDWAASLAYTRRVRRISLDGFSMPDTSALDAIETCFPNGYLFPNLRELSWRPPRHSKMFPYVRLFLTPTLTRINLSVPLDSDIALLPSLPIIFAQLEELGIMCYTNDRVLVRRVSSLIALRLDRIQEIALENLDRTALEHISRLPSLRHLGIRAVEGADSDPPPMESALYPFSVLQSLSVYYTTIELAQGLVDLLPDSQIRSIRVTTCVLATAQAFEKLYSSISRHISPSTLTYLYIGEIDDFFSLDEMPTPPTGTNYVIQGTKLVPLLKFGNLTSITLNSAAGFAITDEFAWDMARAWPKVESLEVLSCTDRHEPPTLTLRGLRAFAKHCKHLTTLKIAVDATRIPPFDNSSETRICQRNLETFDVSESPISNPAKVARFLSGVFPTISGISTVKDWRWGGSEYSDEQNDEVVVEARERHECWMEVQRLMEMFVAVREEEQHWAVLDPQTDAESVD